MLIIADKRNGNEPRHARAFLVTGNTRGHGLPWSLYRCGSRATRTRDAQKTGSFDSLVKITRLYTPSIIRATRDQIKIQTITLSKKKKRGTDNGQSPIDNNRAQCFTTQRHFISFDNRNRDIEPRDWDRVSSMKHWNTTFESQTRLSNNHRLYRDNITIRIGRSSTLVRLEIRPRKRTGCSPWWK